MLSKSVIIESVCLRYRMWEFVLNVELLKLIDISCCVVCFCFERVR